MELALQDSPSVHFKKNKKAFSELEAADLDSSDLLLDDFASENSKGVNSKGTAFVQYTFPRTMSDTDSTIDLKPNKDTSDQVIED